MTRRERAEQLWPYHCGCGTFCGDSDGFATMCPVCDSRHCDVPDEEEDHDVEDGE